MDGTNLYLKRDECKFLGMAVVSLIEQLKDTSTDQLVNWNPESRKDFKNMIEAGNNLKIKLNKLGFDLRDLPPYKEGDEKQFLTKES